MKLAFVPLDKLCVSKTNMRHGRKAPDVADLLPTIRARGVLQTLVVRPRCDREPDPAESYTYEIIAGRRRYHAALLVAGETGEAPALPCAILDAGDDAAAIEASMIENMARLDADEVSQWESFTRLVKQGRTLDEIGATFGLPDLAVRRILALGNLLPRIRDLYRRETIDAATVRHLTLASKAQQIAWLALLDDEDASCPTGHYLKSWLFAGALIPTRHALFDLATYDGGIVTDLFGEGGYFADADQFWTAQNAAIEDRRAAYLDAGWADVVIVAPSEHFATWDYEKTPKRKGGRVYIDVRSSGEVIFHEGYVSRREAARARAGATAGTESEARKPARPEISGPMQTYIDLHRHAAVRAELLGRPGLALRLMVAHAIAGSAFWHVSIEPRTARNEAIAESAESSAAEAAFDEARRALLAPLGLSDEEATLTGFADESPTVALFNRLIALADETVMAILAIVMGETLACGGVIVEALDGQLGTDMARWWQADDAFFATLRDRETLGEILAEVAGETVARANAKEKGKTVKAIIRAHLDGEDGRIRVEHWVPRWMRFPPSAYTARGGVGTVDAAERVDAIIAMPTLDDHLDGPDTAAIEPVQTVSDGTGDRLAA